MHETPDKRRTARALCACSAAGWPRAGLADHEELVVECFRGIGVGALAELADLQSLGSARVAISEKALRADEQ